MAVDWRRIWPSDRRRATTRRRRRWSRRASRAGRTIGRVPDARPGRGPRAARRRPAIRAAPGFPAVTMLTGGGVVRPGDRGQELQRELGIEVHVRDDGRSSDYFDRLARGPADDLVARLGRRLPGPRTTSWACCSDEAARTTTAAGRTPTFDAAIARRRRLPTDPAAARRGLRPRPRPSSARRGPGRAGHVRHGLGAVARRAARGRPERARRSSGWRGWHGPTDEARRRSGGRGR